MRAILLTAAAVLAGCHAGEAPAPQPSAAPTADARPNPSGSSPPASTPSATPAPMPLLGGAEVLREWRAAESRERCPPIAFASDGGQPARVRRAEFGTGWGVAFDQPATRSLYGVAGTGLRASEGKIARADLEAQWPEFRELPGLPQPAFAGYGVVGAEPYPASNPEGLGMHSVAYVRLGGADCLYNVWSRVSRAHLEALLDSLRAVSVD